VKRIGEHPAAQRDRVKRHLVRRAAAIGSVHELPPSWVGDAIGPEPVPGDQAEDLEGSSEIDKSIRKQLSDALARDPDAMRGAAIRKAQDGYLPSIPLGPNAPGWPEANGYSGSGAGPVTSVRGADAGRAQLGRAPATGRSCVTDDPDAADSPYAMMNWDPNDNRVARKAKAVGELEKRAKKVQATDGMPFAAAYDKVMRSPAGQDLYDACR